MTIKNIFKIFIVLMFVSTFVSAKESAKSNSTYKDVKGLITVTINYIKKDDLFEFIVTGKTTGWVAIGLSPTTVMKNGEILIGYVKNGKTIVEDHWGISPVMHAKKSDQSELTSFEGTEIDKVTTLTIRRKASISGKYLKKLTHGATVNMIWALGRSDSLKSMHKKAGKFTIVLP